MRRVVWHMHDICMIHIRRNCVHGLPNLLVVKWLGLWVTVRFLFKLKCDKHLRTVSTFIETMMSLVAI